MPSSRQPANFKDALPVTVKAIQGEFAQVQLPEGETEYWHLDGLPQGLKAGDVLQVRAGEGRYEVKVAGHK